MLNGRPPLHALVYGDPGSKKSTFAATFPLPMNVFFFDPIGKDGPYLRVGNPTDFYHGQGENFLSRDVIDDNGELMIRLNYFGDVNPKQPTGFKAFLTRMQQFYNELDYWQTAVVDSLTFMEFTARKHEQYVLNKSAKDQRQWWAGATDALEEMIQGSLGAMPINVVVIAHIDEHKDDFNGQILRRPKAPGRLSKGVAAGYSEVYHAFAFRDEQGKQDYALQTEPDNMWICESQVNAPNPCWPNYDAIWEGQ